jgi:hypothetical protein
MESVAAYAYTTGDDRAKSLTAQYLQFLLDDYAFRGSNRPLTNVIPVGRPQSNYEYPYSSALIGQTALWGNLAGIDSRLTTRVMEIALDYLESQYVSTGVMAGTYSAGQPTFVQSGTTYNQYFPFWHGGIVEYISTTIENNETIVYPPETNVDVGVFPSIEPTKILSIKEPVFKSKELRFSDGNRQVILPRKTPSGKTLSLQYDKVTASELDTFVEFYRIHGTSELFTLPTNIPILLPYRLYNGVLNHWRLTNELDIETIVSTSTNGAYTFVLNMEVTENLSILAGRQNSVTDTSAAKPAVYVPSVVENPQVKPVGQRNPLGLPAPKSTIWGLVTVDASAGNDINGTVPVVGAVVLSNICKYLNAAFLLCIHPHIT